MFRSGIGGLAVAAAVLVPSSSPAATVSLAPGDDIQTAVNANPPRTAFMLAAGIYRLQSVTPKSGDSFTGQAGALLDGAKLLTDFNRGNGLYVARHQPIDPDTQIQGVCLKQYPRCDRPQDLYFDNAPLHAVAKRSDVAPGKWYYDYDRDAVYFADDPAGHVVELSYRPFAFGGSARNVTVQNLVVEKYAAADQQAAIGDHGEGSGWTIADNEVRLNHGLGVVSGAKSRVMDNDIHHNGEMGIGGGASDGALIEGNEIAFNVWNGTDCGWECGGAKWAVTTKLKVIGNFVHDNAGDGLWTDIDSSDILYERNDIENNLYAGISHEISGHAVIRNNVLKNNGAATFGWGWQGQIQIQNSSDTEVYGNTLVLDPTRGGNGIIVIQQDRGAGHMPQNNSVHGNDTTMAAPQGAAAGWFADYKWNRSGAENNLFDHNRYHVGQSGMAEDVWAPNNWVPFAKWQASGQDLHSTVDGEVSGGAASAPR